MNFYQQDNARKKAEFDAQLDKETEVNDQEILMAKTKDAVRHDGFVVSDNYLKGCDYPYGGGYLISCEGSQFGSLRHQGGGVIFTAEAAEYYIIDAEEIPILVNRVVMAWRLCQDFSGCDFNTSSFGDAFPDDDEPEWDRKYDKGGASR